MQPGNYAVDADRKINWKVTLFWGHVLKAPTYLILYFY